MLPDNVRNAIQHGVAIPAHPLALDAERRLDERRQRALSRYYIDSGVGGLAVGVHTTQFEIHDEDSGLLEPVLALAAEEMRAAGADRADPLVAVAGICGETGQAVREASIAKDLGYHAGLVSLAAFRSATDAEMIAHCRAVSEVIPVFGFYLQPSVGGRVLSYGFWREFFEIENVVAVKMAPFNRYQTIDVVRAVIDAGRDDVALYTGNDDNILMDLAFTFRFLRGDEVVNRRIVGGLLGHWAVWTKRSVELFHEVHQAADGARESQQFPASLLRLNGEVTDSNAVLFDAANGFAGCLPGIHEVLRRQGLLAGTWCLDRSLELSPGQREELDRVQRAYPHLNDDEFVNEHLDRWLGG